MARPRTPKIDIPRIVQAALELADEHGDFTLGEIATRLSVHASSLYHHVAGREEVLEHVRAWFAARIELPPMDIGTWDVALIALARSYRAAFRQHPGSVRLLAAAPVHDADTLAAFESIAELLVGAGFEDRDVVPLMMSLDNFVLGSALEPLGDDLYSTEPGVHPTLTRSVGAARGPVRPQDRAFELGLQSLVSGYRALLHPPADPATAHNLEEPRS
ncbi:MAG: TetR/AcrR family transcriptional regulator [Aeromicrobium sp.]